MPSPKNPCVYILSNFTRTVFYIGVTSDLHIRLQYHKRGNRSSFVFRYNLYYLVYVEYLPSMADAIFREKQLKSWHRQWKIDLIRSVNPTMRDLTNEIFPPLPGGACA